jgi:hypothetical protein
VFIVSHRTVQKFSIISNEGGEMDEWPHRAETARMRSSGSG